MINYDKIADAIDREADLAYSIGELGEPSATFLDAVELLDIAIDKFYSEADFMDLIRFIRNDHFRDLRGEEKSIMDNLLTRVLDIVSFG